MPTIRIGVRQGSTCVGSVGKRRGRTYPELRTKFSDRGLHETLAFRSSAIRHFHWQSRATKRSLKMEEKQPSPTAPWTLAKKKPPPFRPWLRNPSPAENPGWTRIGRVGSSDARVRRLSATLTLHAVTKSKQPRLWTSPPAGADVPFFRLVAPPWASVKARKSTLCRTQPSDPA